MQKTFGIFLTIILFLSTNSTLLAQRYYDERVVKPTPSNEEDPTTKPEENPSKPVDQETFVRSVADAKDVVESIIKFLDDRVDQIEFYEFLEEDTARTLNEEISDIKTKIARIEDGLDGIEIETFDEDMPEIQNELISINNECLALNETQQEVIIEELQASYIKEHKEFHKLAVSIFEEYKDFLENETEIKELLDENEKLIDELQADFDDDDLEELDENEEELTELMNAEALRHKSDQ